MNVVPALEFFHVEENHYYNIAYNTAKFNFADIVKEWFGTSDLETLHQDRQYDLLDREHDQSTHWHQLFYEKFRSDESFNTMYLLLLKHIKTLVYHEQQIVYQRIPSFRVHLPNNVAVGEFHKDKDYRDPEWAKRVMESNFYLPLTTTNEHNTIWAESEEDKKDYAPMLADYGECLMWDGSNLTHGSKTNKSDKTRVSVDFRIIPKELYEESSHGSINTKVTFKIGGYYEIL
jgi:hypothetical protein